MTVAPRARALRRLRLGLLAAFFAVLAGLVGLYLFGRAGREPRDAPLVASEVAGEEVRLAGQGFDYTLTQGATPLFRIRGERIRSDRADNVELEGAALTLYRADGGVYHLEGAEAFYNRSTQEARVAGGVRIAGPGDVVVETAGLELAADGAWLTSLAPVRFGVGDEITGTAGALVFNFRSDVFSLRQVVRAERRAVSAEPRWSLVAQRLVFDRGRHVARAERRVQVRRGADLLRTQRLLVGLSADGREVQWLRARGAVEGETHEQPGATTRFAAERLAVAFGADGEPAEVEMTGDGERRARLEMLEPGAPARTLTAPRLTGALVAGRLAAAEAEGGIVLDEDLAGGGARTATAERARAEFADSRLESVSLLGAVELRDPQLRASGTAARYAPAAARVVLTGEPVSVAGERGTLRAPRVEWDLDAGVARADGGVQAEIRDPEGGAFAGTPLAGGEGPVRVEAAEAEWHEGEQRFLFRGAVRAWRGEDLLLAAELRGSQAQGVLQGSGGVRTVWAQPPAEPAAESAAARPPMEVSAEGLEYARGERRLRYSGQVVVRQAELTMACATAEVELDDDDRARRMTCSGGVRLDDVAQGRQVSGESADYDLESGLLTVSGAPVVLVDRARGRAEGRTLIYDVEARAVRLLATVAEPDGGEG